MTRRALRSRTAVVRIMVSSTVERIGAVVRAVRRVPYPPLTRYKQKNGGQTATEALLCSGYVYIILQQVGIVNKLVG